MLTRPTASVAEPPTEEPPGPLRLAAEWLVVALAALVPWQIEAEVLLPFGNDLKPTLTPFDLLLPALLVLAAALVVRDAWRGRLRWTRLDGWASALWALFVLWSASAFWRGLPDETYPEWRLWFIWRLALIGPLVYLAVRPVARRAVLLRRTAVALIASASLAAAVGIVQAASGGAWLSGLGTSQRYLDLLQPLPQEVRDSYQVPELKLYVLGTPLFRAHGGFYSHNFFASLLNLTLPLTLAATASANTRRGHRWGLLAVALQSTALLLSFSRGGWVAFLLSALLLVWWLPRRRALFGALLGGGVALLSALAILLLRGVLGDALGRFSSVLTPGDAVDLTNRIPLWREVVKVIAGQPLFGRGNSLVETSRVGWVTGTTYITPHNAFLEVAYARGLPALAAFVGLVGLLGWRLWRWTAKPPTGLRWLGPGLLAGMIGLFVHGLIESTFLTLNMQIVLWLWLALAIAPTRERARSQEPGAISVSLAGRNSARPARKGLGRAR